MFVLRIEAGGKSTETRWTGAEGTLGSDAQAAVRREDAGWAPVEAWAWHAGTSVVVVRGDGSLPRALRVGESLELGRAKVTLTQLLPRLEGGHDPVPPSPASPPRPGGSGGPRPLRRPGARFAPETDFGSELVASLRRAPWFALSAALHAVAAFVLFLAMPDEPPVRDALPRVARFESALGDDAATEASFPEETDLPPEPPAAPEDDPPVVDPSDAEPSALPAPDLLEVPEPPEPPPPPLGTSLSLSSVRVRRTPPTPPPDPAPPLVGADVVNHDPEHAGEQNRRAAAVVLDAVRRGGGPLAKALRALRPEDVLVVKGAFDEMEKTLDALGLPYTLRTPDDIQEGYDLERHRAVFWNCGEFPTRTHRAALAGDVRRFVQSGGFLFTTDWMVSNLLTEAFPGYLATDGRERPLPEAIVDVRPAPGLERHPLLDGVFHPGARAKWWIEATTHGVSVKNPARVETLIESPGLSTSHGSPSDAVAVTFTYGRGRVLHLLGHYYQKEGSLAGTMAAQRIALNFLGLRLAGDDGR